MITSFLCRSAAPILEQEQEGKVLAKKKDASEFIDRLRSSEIGARLEKDAEAGRLAAKRAAVAAYDKMAADAGERVRKAQAEFDNKSPKLAEARAKAREALARIENEALALHAAVEQEQRQGDREINAARLEIERHVNPAFRAIAARFREEIEETRKLPAQVRDKRDNSVNPPIVRVYSTRPAQSARMTWFECGQRFIVDLAYSLADDGDEALERAEKFIFASAPSCEHETVVFENGRGEQRWHWALRDAVDAAKSAAIQAFEKAREKFEKAERERAKNEGAAHG